MVRTDSSRESFTSSPVLDNQHAIGEFASFDTDDERKEEEEEGGEEERSVGNSVSMTPLLNVHNLMK